MKTVNTAPAIFILLVCCQSLSADVSSADVSSSSPNASATNEHSIQTLLNDYAGKNKTTIIVDPRADASVTLYGKKPIDITETDLHAILHVHGLSMVKTNQLYIVKPIELAKQSGVVVLPNESQPLNASQLVTTVINLNYISATDLIPVLKPLIPNESHIAAFGPGNQLVVTDTLGNTNRIIDIIGKIDTADAVSNH